MSLNQPVASPVHLSVAAETGQNDTLVREPSPSYVVTIFKNNLAENTLIWKWFKMLAVVEAGKFQICFSQSAGISLCLQLNSGIKEN